MCLLMLLFMNISMCFCWASPLPGALYYFALAHQADFDVRWCRGPIGTLIFGPLVKRLEQLGVKVVGEWEAGGIEDELMCHNKHC